MSALLECINLLNYAGTMLDAFGSQLSPNPHSRFFANYIQDTAAVGSHTLIAQMLSISCLVSH